jgi:hypothetical protein
MVFRDPLFAIRRTAKNFEHVQTAGMFEELDLRLSISSQILYVIFVHGGLSCCYDAFSDLFLKIAHRVRAFSNLQKTVRFLRYEHDTFQSIRVNAERLVRLVEEKLPRRDSGNSDAQLLLIGHSRGGIVTRLASDILIDRSLWNPARMEVFTYGSPHRGTPLFDSTVTWLVDRLIRVAGIVQFSLGRFAHEARESALMPTIGRRMRIWRRRLIRLLRPPSGRSEMKDPLRRAQRWPPGILDVRETSDFITALAEPRCARFWAVGSCYDIRANPQKLDFASRYVLFMVQRAFVERGGPVPGPDNDRTVIENDLVVPLRSALAVGKPIRVRDDLWHCGYFKGGTGERLADYLERLVEVRTGVRHTEPIFEHFGG